MRFKPNNNNNHKCWWKGKVWEKKKNLQINFFAKIIFSSNYGVLPKLKLIFLKTI